MLAAIVPLAFWNPDLRPSGVVNRFRAFAGDYTRGPMPAQSTRGRRHSAYFSFILGRL